MADGAAFNSPLLRLPAELRNKIYDYVLEDITVTIGKISPRGSILRYCDNSKHELPKTRATAGLLNACRQTYTETKPLFYTRCIFDFSSTYPMFDIAYDNIVVIKAFEKFVVIRSIQIGCHYFSSWSWDRVQKKRNQGTTSACAMSFPLLERCYVRPFEAFGIPSEDGERALFVELIRWVFGKSELQVHFLRRW